MFLIFLLDGGPTHDTLGYSNGSVLNFFFKKNLFAVVTVQKQYQQKFVPCIKKWYYGTSVHFGNDIREHLEGPVIFFFVWFVSLRKVALSRSILCGHDPENQ